MVLWRWYFVASATALAARERKERRDPNPRRVARENIFNAVPQSGAWRVVQLFLH